MERVQEKNLIEAKTAVYRLFKYRPRSEQEIKDKLKKKSFSDNIIAQALDYFKRLELVNDRKFAKAWITSRLRKPLGAIRIKIELKTKGIAPEIVEEELKEACQDYSEEDAAVKLAIKQAAKQKNIDKLKVKQRVYNYLLRRGFTSSATLKAIHKI